MTLICDYHGNFTSLESIASGMPQILGDLDAWAEIERDPKQDDISYFREAMDFFHGYCFARNGYIEYSNSMKSENKQIILDICYRVPQYKGSLSRFIEMIIRSLFGVSALMKS